MAGTAAPTTSPIPGNAVDYGSAYSKLTPYMTGAPQGLFNGLGPAALDTSAIKLETFNPTDLSGSMSQYNDTEKQISDYSNQLAGLYKQYQSPSIGAEEGNVQAALNALKDKASAIQSSMVSSQNQNVAGYDATQKANAEGEGYLQQAAIAQNRLLGELNQRGLLGSFERGGAGTGEMQQLQNSINSAENTQGQSLQNELSGLTENDTAYQTALSNYQNELGNFGNMKSSNASGITDVLGLAASAIPFVKGII